MLHESIIITMMISGCLLQQMQVTIMAKGTQWTSINGS